MKHQFYQVPQPRCNMSEVIVIPDDNDSEEVTGFEGVTTGFEVPTVESVVVHATLKLSVLECTIMRVNNIWFFPNGSDTFQIQTSLRRSWGYEVQLKRDLPPLTTIVYTGASVKNEPNNGFGFALSNGRYINGLHTRHKSIALLFNDDYANVVERKCVWTAHETPEHKVEYCLETGGSAGDICCVSYGDGYFDTHSIYCDMSLPDIIYVQDQSK